MLKFILKEVVTSIAIGWAIGLFICIVHVSMVSPKKVAFAEPMKAIRDEQKEWVVAD